MDKRKRIEVTCVTLRDGGQVPGVRLSSSQKLQFAEFQLNELRVDRIEITSAHVPGEQVALRAICQWARCHGFGSKIEALGIIDSGKSVEWIHGAGCRVINLLVKGSELHCRMQLGWTLEEQVRQVQRVVDIATKRHMVVNAYLEDWSRGMQDSPDFVLQLALRLSQMRIRRLMLCDTLGVLAPDDVKRYAQTMRTLLPAAHLDFHGHDDYGLSTANALAAVKAGADGIHGSMNGLGERTGNTPLEEAVVAIKDHSGFYTGVREDRFMGSSRMIAAFTRRRVAPNKPIVGDDVRTQTAGIHIHGDLAAKLYVSKLRPERFGGKITHALSYQGGRSSVKSNLKKLGFTLNHETFEAVVARIQELSLKRRRLSLADLLSVAADELKRPELVTLKLVDATSISRLGHGASASVTIEYRGKQYSFDAKGSTGGFHAFFSGLRRWAQRQRPPVVVPEMLKFDPDVPTSGDPGALVVTTILWSLPDRTEVQTSGEDPDQVFAGIRAVVDAVNLANHNGGKEG